MKKKITIAYIVCIHVFLGIVLLKSDFVERVQRKFAGQAEVTEYYHQMVRYHSRMDGNVPDGAVLFIGDSITQGLCVSAVVPSSVNYGIGGDTTVGVLQRLPMYSSMKRAGAIVVAIGINDMEFRTNEEILRDLSSIAEAMPPNVPVIFSAILPLDEKARDEWQGRNQRIQILNADLKAFIGNSRNLYFVDAGPLLVDPQGNLDGKYHDGDGGHLNHKGYALWIRELQKTIKIAQGAALDGDSATLHPHQ